MQIGHCSCATICSLVGPDPVPGVLVLYLYNIFVDAAAAVIPISAADAAAAATETVLQQFFCRRKTESLAAVRLGLMCFGTCL